MASTMVLTVQSDETQALLQQLFQLNSNKKRDTALALAAYFKDLASGRRRGILDVQTGSAAPVAASQTLTLVSVVATDEVIIGTETLTFTSSPSTEDDVEVDGAADADDALALYNAINVHSVLSTQIVATVASGVVTITALQKGVIGNALNVSTTGGTITIAASGTHLVGGTGGVEEATSQYALGL